MILVIDPLFPPSRENRGDAGKACIWLMTISKSVPNGLENDLARTSTGYNSMLVARSSRSSWLHMVEQWNIPLVPVIISCAIIVTIIGLAKHGSSGSFSESDLVVVSAVIGLLVIFFGILPVSLDSISYSWHCLESGLPWFCDKASAINSLAWIWLTLLLAPAMAFFAAILFALRKRT